jgi:hypothetical protein
MRYASRRPLGRLCYLVVTATMALGFVATALWAAPIPQSGNITTIADTVYLADGTPASGILIITWPAFETASGTAVAGGTTSVTLGTNGALSVALEPNAGATPAGVYYTVVYQLQPSEVKTEYWVVPVSTSPVTLATVRTTLGSGAAAQPVSMQYVNTQLALKANDSAVVHLAGSETITGVKSFNAAPNVPTPVNAGDVANKNYVDQSVANVGAGNFLPLAGGAMTGPLTLPAGAGYVTQLVGSVSDGAQCELVSSTTLDFYPEYVPALNTGIVVSYRGSGKATAEVVNAASVASLANGADNGSRGIVRAMKTPSARTQADCENAALAILDDAAGQAWMGTYQTWSDFLPGGAGDIFPGDGISLNVPSRNAVFGAIVRAVTIDVVDLPNDRGMYSIEFANDLAVPLAYQDSTSATVIPLEDMPLPQTTAQVGSYYLQNLTEAQLTEVTPTSVSVDAGMSPPSDWGIEVRANDFGWGVANDRNLIGRFTTETFSLERVARSQTYFMRLYDSSSPPKYSRYAAALHVDSVL